MISVISWRVVIGCSCLITSSGCSADLPPHPSSELRVGTFIVDDAGAEVVLEALPTRILSLVPSATEILVALGQLDRLVGRTDFDLDGPVSALPSVGGGLGPSMERVVSLTPDLVIRFRGESDPTTAQQLDAQGIVHIAIRPDGIKDIRRIIGLLGSVVGVQSQADSLNAAIQAQLDEVSDLVGGITPPRVAFLGGNPPSVAGPNTFLHELVERAGGVNAFADIGTLYAPISIEDILRREIDLILTPEGTPIPEALEQITVHRVPLAVLTPGIHVGTSARLLATLLHPARFR